jgi:hypothetical protein
MWSLEVAKKESEGVIWAVLGIWPLLFLVSFPFLAVSGCFLLEELLNNLPKSCPNQKIAKLSTILMCG